MSNLGIEGLEDIEQIGAGGSSRVYRARQADLDRIVAVKVLNPGHDQSVSKRFDRERKAMGRLSLHEGIVPVYSSGFTSHGEPYLVMAYYANGSLQDQIDAGPMEWETAVSYIDVAAETIAAAHEDGVVHLDLKPANILLTNHGAPRIADFGIARLTTGQGASATTGGAAFTPAYSAPETFLEGETGPPSDVYGLGATLWALLVGHPPFLTPGEDTNLMAVIGRVVNNPVGDLRQFTPPAICDVIERAMAKLPEHRYQTARDFSMALKAAAAGASPEFQPVQDQHRGTVLFPAAGSADGSDSTRTRLLAEVQPTPPAPTGPTAVGRPLLQETAQPLPKPSGPQVPGGPTPIFDLDRFRFGPILLGIVAFLAVIALALWALSRSPGTSTSGEAQGPTTNLAGPGIDDGSDGSGPSSSLPAALAVDSPLSTTTTAVSTTGAPSTSSSATTAISSTITTAATTTTAAPSTTATTSASTTTTEAATTTTEATTSTIPTPDAPTGLSASVNGSSVSLSWTAPAGGPDPASYSVYRDGTFVGRTTTGTSFTDTEVPVGSHAYTVRSVGANAARSEPSEPVNVTVEEPTTTTTVDGPPTVQTISTAATTTSITASFSTDQCVTYRVSATEIGNADATPVVVIGPASGRCRTSFDVPIGGLSSGTEYRVSVIVINSAGQMASVRVDETTDR